MYAQRRSREHTVRGNLDFGDLIFAHSFRRRLGQAEPDLDGLPRPGRPLGGCRTAIECNA